MIRFLTLSCLFLIFACQAPKDSEKRKEVQKKQWTDSIYNKMSVEEKVGQLFMIRVYSNKNKSYTDSIKKLIADYHLGGLAFFQGGPVRQAILTNQFQDTSKTPLLIAIDAEWGLNMRLDSTFRYPYNMTLGAIQDNHILEQIGKQIGKHCNRIGIHINFAPVVDINTNPKNPIIGVRSFGEDKNNVSNKAIAFTKGLQSENVLACAKHFPGHGDTTTDSHKTLPTISFNAQRIDSIELYPFKQAFNNGMASVMVAHLNVPSLESQEGLPSSLSYKIISETLKKKLKFKGLILTDALNMKGAANYSEPGEIDLVAFEAGNDMLLLSESIPKATSKIVEAYKNNRISEERLSHSVKKILSAKYDVNLHNYTPIQIQNIVDDLNTLEDKNLKRKAIAEAITLIKGNTTIFSNLQNKKIAYIKLGDGENISFLGNLQKQFQIEDFTENPSKFINNKSQKYDTVIISYHQDNYRKIRQFSSYEQSLIEEIAKNHTVILDVFASQYTLSKLSFKTIKAVIVSYENSTVSQEVSAEIIYGKRSVSGKLPASINKEYLTHTGITIHKTTVSNQ